MANRPGVFFSPSISLRPEAPIVGLWSCMKGEWMSALKKILYVDDEPDIREIAVMSLQLNSEFEVRSARGGAEAIAMAQAWQPDIVLLDVMMPEMDGPMTRQNLAANGATRSIPVAFVTARTRPAEVARFLSMNVVGVIAKPFDPMTLAQEVADLLKAIDQVEVPVDRPR